jgi:hypothetical protein
MLKITVNSPLFIHVFDDEISKEPEINRGAPAEVGGLHLITWLTP